MDQHWFAGQVLLSSARRRAMFERFTDRARRVLVKRGADLNRVREQVIQLIGW
jgi:hypothetical protein